MDETAGRPNQALPKTRAGPDPATGGANARRESARHPASSRSNRRSGPGSRHPDMKPPSNLVVLNINTMKFAARDFSSRRGTSDEHTPRWVCKERATKSGRKRPAALRVAPNLACGFVPRRSQPRFRGCSLLSPRHRPNWAQRTSSYLCSGPLGKGCWKGWERLKFFAHWPFPRPTTSCEGIGGGFFRPKKGSQTAKLLV